MRRHTHNLNTHLLVVFVVAAVAGVALMASVAAARVVRVEVTSREVVEDWPEESGPGAYEVIKGTIYL